MWETDPYVNFRNSESGMVEISGQRYQIVSKMEVALLDMLYKATYIADDGTTIEVVIKLINAFQHLAP